MEPQESPVEGADWPTRAGGPCANLGGPFGAHYLLEYQGTTRRISKVHSFVSQHEISSIVEKNKIILTTEEIIAPDCSNTELDAMSQHQS